MDWDDLRYVLATARSGSFLGASERLKVAHSTVGRRVTALERDLGRQLFKRTRDGVLPTAYCEELLPTAEAIERQMQSLNLDRPLPSQTPEGTVRIHTAPWILERILVPALPSFHEAFPKIQIYLLGDVVDTILDRSVPSISIRAEVMPKRDEVEWELVEAPFSVFHHKDYPPDDLPWATSTGGKMRIGQIKWLEEHGVGSDGVTLLVNDAALVRAALISGSYKGLVSHYLARLSPDLVRTSTGAPDIMRVFRCMTQRRTIKNREVRAALDWVEHTMKTSGIDQV